MAKKATPKPLYFVCTRPNCVHCEAAARWRTTSKGTEVPDGLLDCVPIAASCLPGWPEREALAAALVTVLTERGDAFHAAEDPKLRGGKAKAAAEEAGFVRNAVACAIALGAEQPGGVVAFGTHWVRQ